MGLFDRKKKLNEDGSVDDTFSTNMGDHDIPDQLPVIALKNTVIYPHTVVPVFFEDKSSLQALQEAKKGDGMIGAFALQEEARQRFSDDGDEEQEDGEGIVEAIDVPDGAQPAQEKGEAAKPSQVEPDDIYNIGTACVIHRVMPVSGRKGAMVVLQGVAKVEALEMSRGEQPYLTAIVDEVLEESHENKEVKALMRNALSTAQKIIQNTPYLPQELQIALEDLSDPLKFVYLLATLVRFDVTEKQGILTESDVEEKLKMTAAILSRELEQIELGGKIVSNVKKEFNRMSREAFLKQQMKEIQRELGEENEVQKEAQEYRDKLKKAKLPKEAHKEIEREIERLETMHPHASEYQIIRTYLDLVFDLPWDFEAEEEDIALGNVEDTLDEGHYGLKEAKERILEYLAVRELSEEHRGPILCLVGPPGVGKTSLGKAIAEALGREFVRMSLGGMRDEAEIRGHRRTYVGAMPGRVIQGLRRAGTTNPVFMLDEVDKVGSDYRGDPSSALLEVLDPEQNSHFRDHYLDLDYDLSNVFFIATANVLDTIQPALRDRMEIIKIPGYTQEEKREIAKSHLWPRVLQRHGLKKSNVNISDKVLDLIIDEYTREAGVRNLERELSKLARKVAYKFVREGQKTITISEERVREFLGSQKEYREVAMRTAHPGVVTGLAVTAAGGEILFIEANKMAGSKKFNVTGSLGDVMKESANIAMSLVRSRADNLNIDSKVFKENDIHLHVPQGAVPKDGPSAGIAMTTAIASLLMDKPIKPEVAMTGEVTLSGLVLPIGGVKEKVLAAKRAGISTVILPERNRNDKEEIDKELLEGIDFKFAKNIDEVLEWAIDE